MSTKCLRTVINHTKKATENSRFFRINILIRSLINNCFMIQHAIQSCYWAIKHI